MGVSVALCHICQAPTAASCSTCGRPTCDAHMGPAFMCQSCMRSARRDGMEKRRPRF